MLFCQNAVCNGKSSPEDPFHFGTILPEMLFAYRYAFPLLGVDGSLDMFGSSIAPLPLSCGTLLAASVKKTSFVPDEKFTAALEFEELMTVVLASVVPDDVYVPSPTSHSDPPLDDIQ